MADQPVVTAVAIAFPDRSGGDALILGTKKGSLARKCCDTGEVVSDLGLPCPSGPGTWLWLDGGSRTIRPTEFDEDGGMPWDIAGPAESPAEVERLRLHAEVAELRQRLEDAHFDAAAARDWGQE